MFAVLFFLEEHVNFAHTLCVPFISVISLGIESTWVWDPWSLRPKRSSFICMSNLLFHRFTMFLSDYKKSLNHVYGLHSISIGQHWLGPLDSIAVYKLAANSCCLHFPFLRRPIPVKSLGRGSSPHPTVIFSVSTLVAWPPVCPEDPGSRTPGMSSRILHMGNLTPSPHLAAIVFF